MPALSGSQKAYKDARLGVLRLGTGRLDYYTPKAWALSINGTTRRTDLKRGSLLIQQAEGRYDTASFTLTSGTKPTVGQEVLIGLGETRYNRLFGGRIQKVRQRWLDPEGSNTWYDCDCVGWEWDLDRRLVATKYVAQSIESIVLDILATYTSGFTSLHLQSGLGTLTIEFRFEPVTRCLDRLAAEAGAIWYVDPAKDLHFATSESLGYAPETLSETAVQTFRSLACETDYSQIRTTVWCEGRETQVVADVPAGLEAIPIGESLGLETGATAADRLHVDGRLHVYGGLRAWNYWGAIVAGAPFDYVMVDKGGFTDYGNDPAVAWGPPAADVDDAFYLGYAAPWQDAALTVTRAGVWDVLLVYEYWNGAAWVTLDTTDEPALSTQGTSLLRFQPPTDWASTTVDSKAAYWVRGRIDEVASLTSEPSIVGTWRGLNIGEEVIYISSCVDLDGNDFNGETYWAAIDLSHAVYGTYDAAYGSYSNIVMKSIAGGLTAPVSYGARWEHPYQFVVGDVVTAEMSKYARASIVNEQDDSTAQTALAALEGGTGIREGYVQSGALDRTACETRADAELALYKDPIVTLTYQTRDPCVRPGRSVTVNFANAPNSAMNDTYIIRSVAIGDDGDREMLSPWRSVTASTASTYDFTRIIRRLEEHAGQRAPR